MVPHPLEMSLETATTSAPIKKGGHRKRKTNNIRQKHRKREIS